MKGPEYPGHNSFMTVVIARSQKAVVPSRGKHRWDCNITRQGQDGDFGNAFHRSICVGPRNRAPEGPMFTCGPFSFGNYSEDMGNFSCSNPAGVPSYETVIDTDLNC